jgi:hypothetical protein
VSGTAKQETADGGEEEVETVGFRLNFHFRENPYFNNTVSVAWGGGLCVGRELLILSCYGNF